MAKYKISYTENERYNAVQRSQEIDTDDKRLIEYLDKVRDYNIAFANICKFTGLNIDFNKRVVVERVGTFEEFKPDSK